MNYPPSGNSYFQLSTLLRIGRCVAIAAIINLGTITSHAQTITNLYSGTILRSQTGLSGSEKFFSIRVPSGQTKLTLQTTVSVSGTGDVDLYLMRDRLPSLLAYEAVSATFGSTSERITITNPVAGTYYLMLKGSGVGYIAVTLSAVFEPDGISPEFQWARVSTGSDSGFDVRRGEAVASDSFGNIYVTGTIFGNLAFAGTPMSGASQGFLVKYDKDGNGIWLRSVVGARRSHGVAVANDGSVYVTGESNGDTFVGKYNETGLLLWMKTFPGLGHDEGLGIAWFNYQPAVVVAGYQTQPVERVPSGARVARFLIVGSDGSLVYEGTQRGDNFSYYKSVATRASMVVLTGAFNGTWNGIRSDRYPDGTPSADAMLYSWRLAAPIPKDDTFVVFPSALSIGGTSASDDYGSSVVIGDDDAIYVGGSSGGATHFVTRVSNMVREWTKTIFGYPVSAYYSYSTSADYNVSLAADNRGGVYWAGRYDGSFLGGDSYLVNLDASGMERWEPITADCRTYGLARGPDRSIYLTGSTAGIANFGNVQTNTNTTQIFTAGLRTRSIESSRLTNLSIRSPAGTGAQTLIVGFSVKGSGPMPVLLRGIGPSLSGFGVQGALSDPFLRVYNASGTLMQENDDWGGGQSLVNAFMGVGAFSLAAASKDAALLQNSVPGNYTVHVGSRSTVGVALVEAYYSQLSLRIAQFVNLSARTQVDTGANILIAGFVLSGTSPTRLLIRGIGPSLESFGVGGTLRDPKIRLFNGTGGVIAENDDWGGSASLIAVSNAVGAFPLSANSKDSAIALFLEPGAYTVQLTGVNNTTGVALVEIYEAN